MPQNGTSLAAEHIGNAPAKRAQALLGLDGDKNFPVQLAFVSLGAEVGNARTLSLQLKDAAGQSVEEVVDVAVDLLEQTGEPVAVADCVVAVVTGTAVQGDGDRGGIFRTNASGVLVLDVTEQNGAAITYDVAVRALGRLAIENRHAVAFAA